MEDSPSRQFARQKLQKVRNMNATSSSPLYRAALEEMAGGLGTSSRKRGRWQPQGFVSVHGRKMPRNEVDDATLYQLARLWMLDTATPCDDSEPTIDIFNLPPVSASKQRSTCLSEEKKLANRIAVEKMMQEAGRDPSENIDALREELQNRSKASRRKLVSELLAIEAESAERLRRFEDKTGIRLKFNRVD